MGSLVRLIPLVPIAAAAILAQDPNRISYINESLTVAKSGAKLTPAAAAGNPGAAMSTNNGQARLTVTKGTTADLIRSLETEAGTAIIVFDFTVEFGHLKLDRAKGPAPCDCCRSG